MTTVQAAAPRRADIVCVEGPDVDVGAAQMPLEYQDACACSYVHARTQMYKAAAPGQLLRLMFLSAIMRLTLEFFFFSFFCQPRVSSWLVWPTVMETL